jgi:hypothetical protein
MSSLLGHRPSLCHRGSLPRDPCNGMKAHPRFLVGSSDLVWESYIPIQQWETQMSFPGFKKKLNKWLPYALPIRRTGHNLPRGCSAGWWVLTSAGGGLRSSMVPQSVRFGVRSRKLSNAGQSLERWPKIYYLELLRASEGTVVPATFTVIQHHQPINVPTAGSQTFMHYT